MFCGDDTAAVAVVVVVLRVNLVSISVPVTLFNGDVPAINTKDFAERNLVGKLIDQLDKDVF